MRTGQLLIATSTDLSVPEGDKGVSRMLILSHHQSPKKINKKKSKKIETNRGKTVENNSPYNVFVLFRKSPILFSLITATRAMNAYTWTQNKQKQKIISDIVHICKSDLTL